MKNDDCRMKSEGILSILTWLLLKTETIELYYSLCGLVADLLQTIEFLNLTFIIRQSSIKRSNWDMRVWQGLYIEISDPIHTAGDFGDTYSVLLVLNDDVSSCDQRIIYQNIHRLVRQLN